ncbi:hypothetical protein [Kitasatospora sp. NPDC127060]
MSGNDSDARLALLVAKLAARMAKGAAKSAADRLKGVTQPEGTA